MSAYPAQASFLTETEREIIVLSNEADRALKAREDFSGSQIRTAFTDPRTYLFGLVYLSIFIPVGSVILALPSIVSGLGYKGTSATLMACPPYGLGLLIVLTVGWSVDRYGHRFEHFISAILITIAALIVLVVTTNVAVRYVMYFFVMFMYVLQYNLSFLQLTSIRFAPVLIVLAWLSANVAGTNKRAAATGFSLSLGNIGGAVSGQIYRPAWAPRYVQGHAINLGCYVLALMSGAVLWYSYKRDNEVRDAIALANGGNIKVKRGDMLGEDLGELGDRCAYFSLLYSTSGTHPR
jgi:nitrate/nitrite transporter NarK